VVTPGEDVDLTHLVAVAGKPPPSRRYDLMEVKFSRANLVAVWTSRLPHRTLIPTQSVHLRGATAQNNETLSNTARDESRQAAEVVAERAAGYNVPIPALHVTVLDVLPGAGARDVLQRDDILESLNGKAVTTPHEVNLILADVPPGDGVFADIRRGGLRFRLLVPTAKEAPRFGVLLQSRSDPAALAVPVTMDLKGFGGPSGGLMLGLRVLDSLQGGIGKGFSHIAGTGTLGYDGRVGPIIGAAQKVVSAKAAGAEVFFVPRDNAAELKDVSGIRVVPVATFDEARRFLELKP
jgi:PDZ domain-containing protein